MYSKTANRPRAIRRSLALLALLCCLVSSVWPVAAEAQPSYWLFESGPTRPLALSSDGTRLYAVNTPDAHLEVWDVSGDTPVYVTSVPVGMEPVAVSLRNDSEAWVVNHLSDSVSVVDLASNPPQVVRTLLVGDAPEDVVFAGPNEARRAFVTTAHRGQNTSDPRGAYATAGIGRADVWVFDPAAANDTLLSSPVTILSLFTDRPRALAVSADGETVYAAGFMTGNLTTTIPESALCDPGTSGTCTVPAGTSPGGLPAPTTDHDGMTGPDTGLIVKFDPVTEKWRDERGLDFSNFVRFSLPDYDVFRIDASLPTPALTDSISSVGTVLFGMVVNPQNGHVYVSNTEANNRVRFEGPGTYAREGKLKPVGEPATVRGHLHEARVTVINGKTVIPRRLNTHLDYAALTQPAEARERSLATPMGLSISSDGQTLYLAAFGSKAVAAISVSALEAGTYMPSASDQIALSQGGPTGVVLDESKDRAFVATRFDNGISVLSLSAKQETAHVRNHLPEPASIIYGRPFLYDAKLSSGTGEASCGGCHVFGDLDGLAWDLGNPDGSVEQNRNPGGVIGGGQAFSPLKGPMTTQTLRGMATHGPLHWRGDRTGTASGGQASDEHAGFLAFDVAFDGLLGRPEGKLDAEGMTRFSQFSLRLALPPNPIRKLDNTLRDDEARGADLFQNRQQVDQVSTCVGCHSLDRSQGFFGTGGLTTFENESQEFKVAHLRNLYQKVGMFGMAETSFLNDIDNGFKGPQVRGFGYLHDGSVDTVLRFFHATVFSGLDGETERTDLESFMMAFDSNLAPIVGQQVTIDAQSEAAELTRLTLLDARAGTSFVMVEAPQATECDLIALGVVQGELRGYLRGASGSYQSDRTSEAGLSLAQLTTLAQSAGNRLTFTCAAPGSGLRMALDRDEDGKLNRDELDMGTDPIDRPFPGEPAIDLPDAGVPDASVPDDAAVTSPTSDAAVPTGADAGAAKPNQGGDGCGCRVGARSDAGRFTHAGITLLFCLAGLRRHRRARRIAGQSA